MRRLWLALLIAAAGCGSAASSEPGGAAGATGGETAGSGAGGHAGMPTASGGAGTGGSGRAGGPGGAPGGGGAGSPAGGAAGASGGTGPAAGGAPATGGAAGPGGAPASAGSLIQNDVFWRDTAGAPIYSQSGTVIQVGATYYWYGDKYAGAVTYAANPTAKASDVTFEGVTCYSSTDLVHWTDEGIVFRQSAVPMSTTQDWFGRMGVVHNAKTGKYVLIIAYTNLGGDRARELFATSSTPTGNFTFDHIQEHLDGVANDEPGDQTVFTDDDGQAYLIVSSAQYATIDPGPVVDPAGNLWTSWGSGYGKNQKVTQLWLTRLDRTGLPLASDSAYNPPAAPGHALEPGRREGSYVHYHNGNYYLFWNEGGCCAGTASTYTIWVARSPGSITGPYSGNRIFYSSRGNIHGPGHMGIYSAWGVERFTYHYYPTTTSVLGENELSWSSDGWPVAGPPSTTPLKPCGVAGAGGRGGQGGTAAGTGGAGGAAGKGDAPGTGGTGPVAHDGGGAAGNHDGGGGVGGGTTNSGRGSDNPGSAASGGSRPSARDAGGDGAGASPAESAGCESCRVAPGHRTGGLTGLMLLFAIAAVRRRPRKPIQSSRAD